MGESKHTPGPWDYVASTEHHGPYVTSDFGSTIADCYVMSAPGMLSARNGGESKPIHHLGEMADANARLIAAAPKLKSALAAMLDLWGGYECPEVDAAIAVMQELGEDRWSMQAQMDAAAAEDRNA